MPGKCAAPPAPATIRPRKETGQAYGAPRRWLARTGLRSGRGCAAGSMTGRSESEPMMMPTSLKSHFQVRARGVFVYFCGRTGEARACRASAASSHHKVASAVVCQCPTFEPREGNQAGLQWLVLIPRMNQPRQTRRPPMSTQVLLLLEFVLNDRDRSRAGVYISPSSRDEFHLSTLASTCSISKVSTSTLLARSLILRWAMGLTILLPNLL
jgi:hypothetical protein